MNTDNRAHETSPAVRAWRMVRLGLHLAEGVATTALVFPFVEQAARVQLKVRWCRNGLRILGIRLRIIGQPPRVDGPLMLVANHVSWLDIFLINTAWHARFVAKSEIRKWPVVGWLSARSGTLFIERERRRDTARINDVVVAALQAGDRVVVFAEGTTTDGTEVLPFHASLLQPIVASGGTAAPVAMRYLYPDGSRSEHATYTGTRSLLESMRLLASQRETIAELAFCEPVPTAGLHRRDLAEQTATLIAAALSLPAPGTRRKKASGPPAAPPSAPDPTDIPYPEPEAATRT